MGLPLGAVWHSPHVHDHWRAPPHQWLRCLAHRTPRGGPRQTSRECSAANAILIREGWPSYDYTFRVANISMAGARFPSQAIRLGPGRSSILKPSAW